MTAFITYINYSRQSDSSKIYSVQWLREGELRFTSRTYKLIDTPTVVQEVEGGCMNP